MNSDQQRHEQYLALWVLAVALLLVASFPYAWAKEGFLLGTAYLFVSYAIGLTLAGLVVYLRRDR